MALPTTPITPCCCSSPGQPATSCRRGWTRRRCRSGHSPACSPAPTNASREILVEPGFAEVLPSSFRTKRRSIGPALGGAHALADSHGEVPDRLGAAFVRRRKPKSCPDWPVAFVHATVVQTEAAAKLPLAIRGGT